MAFFWYVSLSSENSRKHNGSKPQNKSSKISPAEVNLSYSLISKQRLLTRALNRAEHRLTKVYKILRSSLGPGSSVWEKGKKKRGQIANRKNIGERAFSHNAEPGPRLIAFVFSC